MSGTAYVDESARGKIFLLAVVIVPASSAGELNRLMRKLLLPCQQRIHLTHETDSRRRQIIDALISVSSIKAWIFAAPKPIVAARDQCIRRAAAEIIGEGIRHVVLDQVQENQNMRDRVAIYQVAKKLDVLLSYGHEESRKFAGLQAADVVAWAYGAAGDWRRRILPIVEKAIDL